jgi:hypothetical protein
VAGALTVGHEVLVPRPGAAPERVLLPASGNWQAAPLPGARLRGLDGPGIVVEATDRVLRAGRGRLAPGERRLLLPGESVGLGSLRLEVPAEALDAAARGRALLRAALRGEDPSQGPRLAVRSGPDAGAWISLGVDDEVGRAPGCAMCLTDPTISRRHARIRRDGPAVHVEDAGARNGIRVAGRRIGAARRIRSGEELRLGGTVLVLLGDDDPASIEGAGIARRRGPLALAAAALAATALAFALAGTLG